MATNLGARKADEVTKDITSLSNAGNEPFSTWVSDSGISDPDSVTVIGQEEDDQLLIPDHINDQFHVVAVADGTDVAQGTDIGEVRVRIEGRR